MHSGQSPAKCLIRRKSNAIVGDLDRYLGSFDGGLHAHRACFGVPKNVGDAFLDDAINGLGKQALDVVQPGIDMRCQFEVRRAGAGILQQGLDALLQPQFLDVMRSQPVEDTAVGLLQRLDQFKQGLDGSLEFFPVLRGAVQQAQWR